MSHSASSIGLPMSIVSRRARSGFCSRTCAMYVWHTARALRHSGSCIQRPYHRHQTCRGRCKAMPAQRVWQVARHQREPTGRYIPLLRSP